MQVITVSSIWQILSKHRILFHLNKLLFADIFTPKE